LSPLVGRLTVELAQQRGELVAAGGASRMGRAVEASFHRPDRHAHLFGDPAVRQALGDQRTDFADLEQAVKNGRIPAEFGEQRPGRMQGGWDPGGAQNAGCVDRARAHSR
jgi:hypothetical protein